MFPQLPFGFQNNIKLYEATTTLNLPHIKTESFVGELKDLFTDISLDNIQISSLSGLLKYADSSIDLKPLSITAPVANIKEALSTVSIKELRSRIEATEVKQAVFSNIQLGSFNSLATLTGDFITDFGGFMDISTNTALLSNTRYLSTTSGLVHTFPSAPSVGDIVEMATGNFDTRINHADSSQQVRNLSTLTTAGTDSGVILKPYSVCQFIYVGSNLWITGYRARTINNWLSQSITPLQSYTASGVTPFFGSTLEGLQDGITDQSNNLANGLIVSAPPTPASIQLRIDFSSAYELDYLEFWGGQGNGSTESNMPDSLNVYYGASVNPSNLIGSFSITRQGYVKQTFNISAGGIQSPTYILVFTNSISGNVSFMELRTFVVPTGGEITAT